jgi:hypothetical protein
MTLTARITALVAALGCGLIGSTVMAGADVLPAGNYQITTVTAQASFFNSNPPYDSANVFVTDTITLTSTGSSRGGTNMVAVNASWSGPNGAGGGCSILGSASDFTFSSDLSSAALHTMFTQDLQPCDSFEPLVPDVTLDVAWTGPAAAAGGRNITRYACGGYQSEALSTFSHSVAVANFSFENVAGPYNDPGANMGLNNQTVHAQGSLPDTCIGPSQKGFGIGPHPPGRYILSSAEAGFSSTDGSVTVSVRNTTFTSNPNGPASDISSDTQLFVSVNGSFGCLCCRRRTT